MSAVEEEVVATEEGVTYEFDENFQEQIAAWVLRDTDFNQRTEGLVQPRYMTSESLGQIVSLALDYFNKYKMIPSKTAFVMLFTDAVKNKTIRGDLVEDMKQALRQLYAVELDDKDFTIDRVAEFARHSAMTEAILKSAELVDKRDFPAIEKAIKQALMVGENQDNSKIDFFETIEGRAEYRKELLAGRITYDGITTGFKELDRVLYNKGWGRKELSVIMGAAKAGKSMSLIAFAVNACLAGYNVLYVSLEVAARIIADRMDANIAKTAMKDLQIALGAVRDKVKAASAKAGKFSLFDFPTGSFSPGDLRRLLHREAAKGNHYDMVVVDYADLMRPDQMSSEMRENSRMIYIDLRAISYEFNCALLSATQTNREGFKSTVSKMEHVAEDINKVRTVDLLISINSSDEDKANNEAKLYFAASRNQKGNFIVRVKTNLEQARMIESIIEIEA
ncbi:DnaB-like helicase C-terminal domain-containing protein [Dyella telluris]|uniref:AAA family ATPase n=1 Tax=Dyella telluris TaxID=2763498 RepID=A0A7G8Q4D8_9GAMM|nr:DnaB-like helicase C-terminal domain-containing protein [Dyella telluris]QNK01646.1 AAA family ATPase [Dyella telluris]